MNSLCVALCVVERKGERGTGIRYFTYHIRIMYAVVFCSRRRAQTDN